MIQMVRVEVGGRIRAARKAAHLTQSALAESAGITVESVSRIETGVYEPSLTTTVEIARVLGLALDELVTGDGPKATDLSAPSRRIAVLAAGLDPKVFKALHLILLRISKKRPAKAKS